MILRRKSLLEEKIFSSKNVESSRLNNTFFSIFFHMPFTISYTLLFYPFLIFIFKSQKLYHPQKILRPFEFKNITRIKYSTVIPPLRVPWGIRYKSSGRSSLIPMVLYIKGPWIFKFSPQKTIMVL